MLDLVKGLTQNHAFPDKNVPNGGGAFMSAMVELNSSTAVAGCAAT